VAKNYESIFKIQLLSLHVVIDYHPSFADIAAESDQLTISVIGYLLLRPVVLVYLVLLLVGTASHTPRERTQGSRTGHLCGLSQGIR
jgi:hypothetical protein